MIVWLGFWGFRVSQAWENLQQDKQTPAKEKFSAAIEITKGIVGGIGTVATIGGGIFLYLNFRVANRNAELAESRLITERFSKAVEQLGSDKIEVRLGGIYSLERIAKDSERDHWTIMEVLTSFIQENSPSILPKDDGTEEKNAKPIEKDIQAALTVIGRREANKEGTDKSLDLSYSNLSNANLQRANFNKANFTQSNFIYADLSSANLVRANLKGANLCSVNLSSSNLNHANLRYTDLSHSILRKANLSSAQVSTANLSKANLGKANLNEANLSNTNLSCTNLSNANLSGANLKRANLSNADLHSSDLNNANLRTAVLVNANLSKTDLRYVKFNGAIGITKEQIEAAAKIFGAFMPDGTINNRDLPIGMQIPPNKSVN